MKFCINCGNKLDDQAVFCTSCGHKLDAPEAPQQAQQQQYQAPQAQYQAPQGQYGAPQGQYQQQYQAPQYQAPQYQAPKAPSEIGLHFKRMLDAFKAPVKTAREFADHKDSFAISFMYIGIEALAYAFIQMFIAMGLHFGVLASFFFSIIDVFVLHFAVALTVMICNSIFKQNISFNRALTLTAGASLIAIPFLAIALVLSLIAIATSFIVPVITLLISLCIWTFAMTAIKSFEPELSLDNDQQVKYFICAAILIVVITGIVSGLLLLIKGALTIKSAFGSLGGLF